MHNTLRIATFNIHKGVTHFNIKLALHRQRELLNALSPDILFLQEVRDVHHRHSKRFDAWPDAGQTGFLAQHHWPHYTYGKNAEYQGGHHGNAILSKHPIQNSFNTDISAHKIEQRGMLHCEINIPGWHQPLHTFCVHLGLFAHWRRAQLNRIADYIQENIPDTNGPMIIAGDFNDWSTSAGKHFATRLHLHEVFDQQVGSHARSFPAWLPILKLDRIYVRGFNIQHVEVHTGGHFLKVSDHAILTSTLVKR